VPDPEVLAASAPIAFCSLGTMRGGRGALLAAATAACAGLGLRPVVAHGGRLGEGPAARLPGAPIVRAFVPQRAVLPRCAVAVVHGGLNTALDALAAGVPLVVMPLGFEQPGIAARLRYAGVAEVVSPAAPALRRRLRAALARVLQGAHRARAAHWSATIAACGGAVTVADRIEAAAAAAARAAA
jgi:zeaxanthin glucosyltransferase